MDGDRKEDIPEALTREGLGRYAKKGHNGGWEGKREEGGREGGGEVPEALTGEGRPLVAGDELQHHAPKVHRQGPHHFPEPQHLLATPEPHSRSQPPAPPHTQATHPARIQTSPLQGRANLQPRRPSRRRLRVAWPAPTITRRAAARKRKRTRMGPKAHARTAPYPQNVPGSPPPPPPPFPPPLHLAPAYPLCPGQLWPGL
jgi:hypothetical protein